MTVHWTVFFLGERARLYFLLESLPGFLLAKRPGGAKVLSSFQLNSRNKNRGNETVFLTHIS